jgi:hypothetical protein
MTSHHIPVGRDRVQHDWKCTRRGPFTETFASSADDPSAAEIIVRCEECNGTDEHRPVLTLGPDAA